MDTARVTAHADAGFFLMKTGIQSLVFLALLAFLARLLFAHLSKLLVAWLVHHHLLQRSDANRRSVKSRPPPTLSGAMPIYRPQQARQQAVEAPPRYHYARSYRLLCPKSQQLPLPRIRRIIDDAQSMGTTHFAPAYAADRASFLLDISARIWLWHRRYYSCTHRGEQARAPVRGGRDKSASRRASSRERAARECSHACPLHLPNEARARHMINRVGRLRALRSSFRTDYNQCAQSSFSIPGRAPASMRA